MDDIIEISSLDDLGGSSTSNVAGGKFGEGIELLMNEKKDNPKSSDGIDIGDLEQLEADLNEVSDNIGVSKSSIFTDPIPVKLLLNACVNINVVSKPGIIE